MIVSEVIDTRVGDVHVTPEQIADVNIGTYGPDDYVLSTGRQLEAQVITNNSVRVFDGVMVYGGIRDVIDVNKYYDLPIDNGMSGTYRNDIIVRHFVKEEGTKKGKATFEVVKGTAVSSKSAVVDPSIAVTDLRAGALEHKMLLHRVRIDGLNIVAVEPLYDILFNAAEMKKEVDELNSNKFQMKQAFSRSGIPKELLAGAVSSNVFSCTASNNGYIYADLYTSFPTGNSRKMMILYKNGSEIKRYDDTTGTAGTGSKVSVSALFPVNAGDVITAKIFCASAGAATCNVSIHQFY